jgi:hypothetical protein
MSEIAHGNSRDEIKVSLAIFVKQKNIAGLYKFNRKGRRTGLCKVPEKKFAHGHKAAKCL